MVNWWFGARWFGFLGSPYGKRAWDSSGYPKSPGPKPPIYHYIPEIKVLNPKNWWICLDISPWNLWGYFQLPLGCSRKLVSGLFHLPINGIYWGYKPLILTIYILTSNGTSFRMQPWGPMSSHGWSQKRWNVSGGRYSATRTLARRKNRSRFCYAQLLRNIPIGIKACIFFLLILLLWTYVNY